MIVNSAFQVGMMGVSALRGVVVAVFLTRADYGVWGFVGLTLWTSLGFKSIFGANDKYIQQSEVNQELAFQRAFTVELIFAAALTPVAATVVVLFAVLSGHSSVLAPGLALLLLLPSTALQFPLAVFLRRMQYRRQRMLEAIEPVGGAIVMVAAAALGAGYWSFVGGAVFGSWAAAAVAVRACPYRLRWSYHRKTLINYFGFSASLAIAGVFQLALFYVIYLVGSDAVGLAGLGAFTLVGNLVQFTDQADSMITATLYPAICAVSDRIRLLTEIFVKSNRLSLMWAVPFGVGLTLFGSDLIRFGLGKHWLPALPLLQIMGLVTAVNHVGFNWPAFVRARGITWPIALSAVVGSTVVIAVAIPLMYTDHLVGLGYAFAIGQLVSLTFRAWFITRFLRGAGLLSQLIIRGFAPTAIAALPVLVLRATLGREDSLAAAIGAFALYVVLTIATTTLFERRLLKEAVGYLLRARPQLV